VSRWFYYSACFLSCPGLALFLCGPCHCALELDSCLLGLQLLFLDLRVEFVMKLSWKSVGLIRLITGSDTDFSEDLFISQNQVGQMLVTGVSMHN